MFLADVYYRQADYTRARSTINHALNIQSAALPPDHMDFVWSRLIAAKINMQTGAPNEAETELRSIVSRLTQSFPDDYPGLASARGALGECLLLQSRFGEAEPFLLDSYNVFQARMGVADGRTKSASARLARLYAAWGMPGQAARYGNE
jgi:hypothetical protein